MLKDIAITLYEILMIVIIFSILEFVQEIIHVGNNIFFHQYFRKRQTTTTT